MRKATKEASDVLGSNDVKAIALKLQRMGRGNDRILAHITPREAAKLKREGGSGTRNPNTGLLEFQEGFDIPFEDYGASEAPIAANEFYSGADYGDYQGYDMPVSADYGVYDVPYADYGGYTAGDFFTPGGGYAAYTAPDVTGFPVPGVAPTAPELTPSAAPTGEIPLPPERPEDLPEDATAKEKSALSSLFGKMDASTLARLGLGLGGAFLGQRQAAQARAQGAQAADALKAAYERSAADVRALASPLTTAGAAALGQAQQGVLDPARLQQLEVARAQLAQQAARTGGVGAIQSAEALNRARLAALQAQQTAALQLLGPGNTLMSQAIARQLQGETTSIGTRLQMEQQANQAIAGLYAQLGRFIGG